MMDIDYLAALLETLEVLTDPEAMQMLETSLEDIRAERLVDHDVVEKELG